MKEKLQELLKNAYSPYYKFGVAAIVVTKDGREYRGVNIENAAGTSICAERNAIHAAVTDGCRRGDFDRIYIMLQNGELGMPCCFCRQVMIEFFEKDTKIISVKGDGEEVVHTLEEIAPFPFGPDDL
ncbi:MAG: cytidine deaminase [Clostridia bacterium]|nr:cytidine deaminase [Clostridia bacterium]